MNAIRFASVGYSDSKSGLFELRLALGIIQEQEICVAEESIPGATTLVAVFYCLESEDNRSERCRFESETREVYFDVVIPCNLMLTATWAERRTLLLDALVRRTIEAMEVGERNDLNWPSFEGCFKAWIEVLRTKSITIPTINRYEIPPENPDLRKHFRARISISTDFSLKQESDIEKLLVESGILARTDGPNESGYGGRLENIHILFEKLGGFVNEEGRAYDKRSRTARIEVPLDVDEIHATKESERLDMIIAVLRRHVTAWAGSAPKGFDGSLFASDFGAWLDDFQVRRSGHQ